MTGATGNIGRMLVDLLLAEPASGAEGYIRRVETVPAAVEGVDLMYLAPAPETVDQAVALARDAGVRQIVDLSGQPESWWHPVAAAVESSGVAWTHLWPGEFMENTTMWASQIRTAGAVREPYPASANAPIAMRDVAAVAATVLLEGGHDGQAYALTGPETLTRVEMVCRIGEALGREVRFVTVPPERAVEELAVDMGEYARWYVEGLASLAEHPQTAVRTVEQVTGRPTTTFASWALDNAHLFRGR